MNRKLNLISKLKLISEIIFQFLRRSGFVRVFGGPEQCSACPVRSIWRLNGCSWWLNGCFVQEVVRHERTFMFAERWSMPVLVFRSFRIFLPKSFWTALESFILIVVWSWLLGFGVEVFVIVEQKLTHPSLPLAAFSLTFVVFSLGRDTGGIPSV